MSDTPKITHVQRTNCRTWRLLYADGDSLDLSRQQDIWAVRAALEARDQTLDIPPDVQPGWVGVPTDLPVRPTVPDLTMRCHLNSGTKWWSPHEKSWAPVIAKVTVTTPNPDGDPVATFEWVTG